MMNEPYVRCDHCGLEIPNDPPSSAFMREHKRVMHYAPSWGAPVPASAHVANGGAR